MKYKLELINIYDGEMIREFDEEKIEDILKVFNNFKKDNDIPIFILDKEKQVACWSFVNKNIHITEGVSTVYRAYFRAAKRKGKMTIY